MPGSVYYDSCIFLNALNTTHRDHESCLAITTPANVRWISWVCVELISAETTASELVAAFEVNCALEGKLVLHARLSDAKAIAAAHKNEKIRLKKAQLKERDFSHLMCAVSAKAEALTTVDPDFWDATNKRNPGAKALATGTKKLIESLFPVLVVSPKELVGA